MAIAGKSPFSIGKTWEYIFKRVPSLKLTLRTLVKMAFQKERFVLKAVSFREGNDQDDSSKFSMFLNVHDYLTANLTQK